METVGRKAEAPGQRQKSEKPDQTTRQPYTTCQTCRAQKDSYRANILNLTSECRHDGGRRNEYGDDENDDGDDDKP